MFTETRSEGRLIGNLSLAQDIVTEASRNVGDVSFYRDHANDFVNLHEQVESSIDVLDTLESFLSTFQRDLSDVSDQISDLQGKSKEIESRLKARRKIDRPLANLILDISIPPDLAERILDSPVGEQWLIDIPQLHKHLNSLNSRPRVKAVRALSEVGEGLRIVAATKIRAFLLTMFQPIRSSISTNMQVIQTSVLLKYRPLFSFLQYYALDVATEVQHAYVVAARVYYETGFRRYVRALKSIKSRTSEKFELIGAPERPQEQSFEAFRLANAGIEGRNIVLAYMADDKSHKEPVESLFRSLLLVLMDNGTSEYAFITRFFNPNSSVLSLLPITPATRSPGPDIPTEVPGFSFLGGARLGSVAMESPLSITTPVKENITKEQQSLLDGTWKQVMNPVLEYCQTFSQDILQSSPPTIPLLTMIRLLENVLGEVQKRDCPPLESFTMGLRLTFWPVFQKDVNLHIESMKKLADGASGGGFFNSKPSMRDTTLQTIAQRYAVYFTSFVALTDNEEETMIFSNLLRLRNELIRLMVSQSSKVKEPTQAAIYQSTMYQGLLQALSNGPRPATHPKTQSEIAFWREREVEAQRRIASARRK